MNTAYLKVKVYLREGQTIEDVIGDLKIKVEHDDVEHIEVAEAINDQNNSGINTGCKEL